MTHPLDINSEQPLNEVFGLSRHAAPVLRVELEHSCPDLTEQPGLIFIMKWGVPSCTMFNELK
jgi:hypothetical protein